MSSTSKRQATTPPTVLGLDHVLTAIVQYIPAAKDVKAFLAALPALARGSTHLGALHGLFQAPQRAVLASVLKPLDALWPLLHLDKITPAATHLVRGAMPVFLAASAGTLSAARPRNLEALEWLELWSTKLTHYNHVDDDTVYDHSRLCDVLHQCTNLLAVDVSYAGDADALLKAVTTPAHRVRSLAIIYIDASPCITPLDHWLASGHAEDLDFTYIAGDAAISAMLLKTTVLSRLALHLDAPGLLAQLVVAAPSYSRLTSLHILVRQSEMPSLLQFLQHLRVVRLRSLSLRCTGADLGRLFCVLSAFPVLEELTVASGYLDGTLTLPLILRRVTWDSMRCSQATWVTLVARISQLRTLDELTWLNCELPAATIKVLAEALADWIHRGAQKISFFHCRIDDTGAMALAAALPRTTSPLGVVLDIQDTALLSVQSYVALGEALASCRGISIALPLIETFSTELAKFSIQHRVQEAYCIMLESPVHSG